MRLRGASIFRPIAVLLAATMLVVALACASEEATPEPTSAPATNTPAPTATTPGQMTLPTATPVAETEMDLAWMDRYLKSPGYDPAWGEPRTGGTFIFGSNRDNTDFSPSTIGGCYAHGCWNELAYNSLFRVDPWVGLGTLEGDLAESWEMSADGSILTIELHEGVTFYNNPNLPAEVAGKVNGDAFVCEDAVATFERMARPPEWEAPRLTRTRAMFSHLGELNCPDGPRGLTFEMNFTEPRASTLSTLSRGLAMLDKDWIEWLHSHEANIMREETPDNFTWQSGTGAFIPESINVSVSSEWVANPDYWRTGLPLLDRYENVVIKDPGSRFTALATNKVQFYGEGSYGFTSGQAEQALRDFPETIVVNPQMNMWARVIYFNAAGPPFNDWKAREAVHLAMDREEWRAFRQVRVGDAVLEGTRMAYSVPPGTYFAPSEEELMSWPGWRQPKDEDFALANQLLDEVFGPGERPTMECLAPTPQQSDIDACLFVMDQLAKNVDWEVTSDFMDSSAAYEKRDNNNFTLTLGSGTVSTATGDPDDSYPNTFLKEFVSVSYGAKASLEAMWEAQPENMQMLDDMIRGQSRELDPVKRRELFRTLEDFLRTEVHSYHDMLGWTNIFPSWRVEAKGIKGYDLYSFTKGTMWERVWFGA